MQHDISESILTMHFQQGSSAIIEGKGDASINDERGVKTPATDVDLTGKSPRLGLVGGHKGIGNRQVVVFLVVAARSQGIARVS